MISKVGYKRCGPLAITTMEVHTSSLSSLNTPSGWNILFAWRQAASRQHQAFVWLCVRLLRFEVRHVVRGTVVDLGAGHKLVSRYYSLIASVTLFSLTTSLPFLQFSLFVSTGIVGRYTGNSRHVCRGRYWRHMFNPRWDYNHLSEGRRNETNPTSSSARRGDFAKYGTSPTG
jgi:hypothetical protein